MCFIVLVTVILSSLSVGFNSCVCPTFLVLLLPGFFLFFHFFPVLDFLFSWFWLDFFSRPSRSHCCRLCSSCSLLFLCPSSLISCSFFLHSHSFWIISSSSSSCFALFFFYLLFSFLSLSFNSLFHCLQFFFVLSLKFFLLLLHLFFLLQDLLHFLLYHCLGLLDNISLLKQLPPFSFTMLSAFVSSSLTLICLIFAVEDLISLSTVV